jgi:hypothetical protein
MHPVPSPTDIATTNGAVVTSPPDKTRTRRRRRLWIAVLLAFGIAWAIAITYSVTAGGRSPERLTEAQARTVNAACLDAQHALARLPAVDAHAPPAQRADRVDGENAILTSMIERFLAVHPKGKDPAAALRGWTRDWSKLIAARADYVSALRSKGNDARFVEPATSGVEPIVNKMNDWTLEQGTRTDRCNTGELQAEVVEGERIYGSASRT